MVRFRVELLKEIAGGIGEVADGCGDRLGSGSAWLGEDGPAWTEDVVIQGVVEASHLPTVEGDHIAVRAW